MFDGVLQDYKVNIVTCIGSEVSESMKFMISMRHLIEHLSCVSCNEQKKKLPRIVQNSVQNWTAHLAKENTIGQASVSITRW